MNPPGCTSSCIGFEKKPEERNTLQGWNKVITESHKRAKDSRKRWQKQIGAPSDVIQIDEFTYGFWQVKDGVYVIRIDKQGPNPGGAQFFSSKFIDKLVRTQNKTNFIAVDLTGLEMRCIANPDVRFEHFCKLIEQDDELRHLGFVAQKDGQCVLKGCCTVPCFGGKMPDQAKPKVLCAIIQSVCNSSPRQMMKFALKGEDHDNDCEQQSEGDYTDDDGNPLGTE
jgi:hypothetical protein